MEMWMFAALGAVFLVYLLYTRQFKWLLSVVRNMFVGVAGILVGNLFLGSIGLIVGINALTAMIVGVLGVPGFLLLYASQMIIR